MKGLILLFASLSLPIMNAQGNVYDVTYFGAIADDGKDDSLAFQSALAELNDDDTLMIPNGLYDICRTISLFSKRNISIIGAGKAELAKCDDFVGEYLLYIKHTTDLMISDVVFTGLNNGNSNQVWGEQGLYLASTKNSMIVNNEFYHFGDAALRITTSPDEGKYAVGSEDIIVMKNKFQGCAQVTTTQATKNTFVGGSNDISIIENQFIECSLKLSSRTEVSNAKVINNDFNNITGSAVELSYYSDVLFENNNLSNIDGFLLNIYPNSRSDRKVSWGGLRINHNQFSYSQQGIRLQSYSDWEQATSPIENISITNNEFQVITFDGVSNPQYQTAIRTITKDERWSFSNVAIKNNSYRDEYTFLFIDKNVIDIDIEGNNSIPVEASID
ncbi:hypothetical protein L4C39_05465 [Vibrio clamense]|uniref:hypothetical protein n=1 Tax=Vibrio clamense TaxID=2910254 RepID=UPI003D1FBBE0